jgi:hypothetical protein
MHSTAKPWIPSPAEQRFLQEAADYLERPTFLMQIANLAGKPAEALLAALPNRAREMITSATSTALARALEWAVWTLPQATAGAGVAAAGEPGSATRLTSHLHTALAATTGAVGGFFGLAALAVEIPATTTVMLRSIAHIAAESGADMADPATRLQCLAVFSYGAPSLDAMESAYITGRLGMAVAITDAAVFVAGHSAREIGESLTKGTASALVRLVNQIASKFEIVVSQKAAAQAVPIVGAASGALINAAFTDHFNAVARYHFGIVRLERLHGKDPVQAAYQAARHKRAAEDVAG